MEFFHGHLGQVRESSAELPRQTARGKSVRGGTVRLVLGEGDTMVGAHVGEFAATASVGVGLLVQDEGVHDPQEWDEIGVHAVSEQFVVEQAQIVGGVVDDQG